MARTMGGNVSAFLNPWNWILVGAIIVCSGPLTVAAVCTSVLSAIVLFLIGGCIIAHAFFTSIYQVFSWPFSSAPSSPTVGHSHGRPTHQCVLPLLMMQRSSRSRASRRSSLSQRGNGNGSGVGGSGGGSNSTAGGIIGGEGNGGGAAGGGFSLLPGASALSGGSSSGVSSSSSSTYNGHAGNDCSIILGGGAGNSSCGGARRRHSLIPAVGGGLDGYYGDEGVGFDDPYYYPVEDDNWPSDYAPQLILPSHMIHQGGDMNPKMRGGSDQHQILLRGVSQVIATGAINSTTLAGMPLPVASNSSRRRASIGAIPSQVRADITPVIHGIPSSWRTTRHSSDVGL